MNIGGFLVREFIICVFFGMLWGIPKIGKIIFAGCIVIAAIGLIIYPDTVSFLYSNPWYINALDIIVSISGLRCGDWLINETIKEWKK